MKWFTKEKKVYYDSLNEWKKNKCWDFNLFDKVIVYGIKAYWSSRYEWDEAVILKYDHEDEKYWQASGYSVQLKDWRKLHPWEEFKIKKSYWEFQEEFEAAENMQKKAQDIKRLEEEMKEAAKQLQEYHKKASKIKESNIIDIHNKIK